MKAPLLDFFFLNLFNNYRKEILIFPENFKELINITFLFKL